MSSSFRTPAPSRIVAVLCVSWVTCSFTGCVALGVPSNRFHDPDDHGGLLGDWRRGRPHTAAQHTRNLIEDGAVIVPSDGHGVMCGSGVRASKDAGVLSGDFPMDLDPSTGRAFVKPEKPPEVPWPRYHPVPTRPVFGGDPFGGGSVVDPMAGI